MRLLADVMLQAVKLLIREGGESGHTLFKKCAATRSEGARLRGSHAASRIDVRARQERTPVQVHPRGDRRSTTPSKDVCWIADRIDGVPQKQRGRTTRIHPLSHTKNATSATDACTSIHLDLDAVTIDLHLIARRLVVKVRTRDQSRNQRTYQERSSIHCSSPHCCAHQTRVASKSSVS